MILRSLVAAVSPPVPCPTHIRPGSRPSVSSSGPCSIPSAATACVRSGASWNTMGRGPRAKGRGVPTAPSRSARSWSRARTAAAWPAWNCACGSRRPCPNGSRARGRRSRCRRIGRPRSSSLCGMRTGTGCMPSRPPTSCTISCFGSRRRTAACASSARSMTRCGACHRPCACGAGTTTSGPATGCASPRRSRIASRAHPPMGTSGQANSNAPQTNEAVKPCTSG